MQLEVTTSQGEIWLNVASSHDPVDGFLNLDNHFFLMALQRLVAFTGTGTHWWFGLAHRWMYDARSVRAQVEELVLEILATNETPSSRVREGDGLVQIVARRPR